MTRDILCAVALAGGQLLAAASAQAAGQPAPGTPAAQLIERLDAALEGRGPTGRHEIELDNPAITLPKDASADAMRVEALTVDAKNGRLTATLTAPAGDRLRVTGRVYQVEDVVVPGRTIAPGEVIAATDLEHATLRFASGLQDALIAPASLIGKTPRHALRAQEPVHAADLQDPLVIHRGELVTMTLETPLMSLSTQGQAMDDAARGAAVRVGNVKTNRIVEAVATGPGTVSVQAPAVP